MPKSVESQFTKSEAYKRAMEVLQELDYTEVWHLIREAQGVLAQKSYEAAKVAGETNGS